MMLPAQLQQAGRQMPALPGPVLPGQQPVQAATAATGAAPQVVAAASTLASQQDTSSNGQSVEVLLRILTNSANAQLQLDHLQRASKNAELQTAIGIQGKPNAQLTFS